MRNTRINGIGKVSHGVEVITSEKKTPEQTPTEEKYGFKSKSELVEEWAKANNIPIMKLTPSGLVPKDDDDVDK